VRLGLPRSDPLGVVQWGTLIAVNYAARPFGVKRGMSGKDAQKLCPSIHLAEVELISVNEDVEISDGVDTDGDANANADGVVNAYGDDDDDDADDDEANADDVSAEDADAGECSSVVVGADGGTHARHDGIEVYADGAAHSGHEHDPSHHHASVKDGRDGGGHMGYGGGGGGGSGGGGSGGGGGGSSGGGGGGGGGAGGPAVAGGTSANAKVSLRRYRAASREVMAVVRRFVPHGQLERASIDEVYCDLTPQCAALLARTDADGLAAELAIVPGNH
jgi:hypothetical protein